jgi:hypothetical protein
MSPSIRKLTLFQDVHSIRKPSKSYDANYIGMPIQFSVAHSITKPNTL